MDTITKQGNLELTESEEADRELGRAVELVRAGNLIGATFVLTAHHGASFKAAEAAVAHLARVLALAAEHSPTDQRSA